MGLVVSPTPVLGPVADGVPVRRSKLVEEMWRYLQCVGDGASAYGTFTTPVFLAGECDITLRLSTYPTAVSQTVLSASDSSHFFQPYRTDGLVAWYVNGLYAVWDGGAAVLSDGKTHEITLRRTSVGVMQILHQGTVVASQTGSSGAITINTLGRLGTTQYFKGNILSLSIRDYTSRGAELVTNGTFDTTTTGWTLSGSGTIAINSERLLITNNAAGGDQSRAYQTLSGLTVGATYVLSASWTNGTVSSALLLRDGANIDSGTVFYNGTFDTLRSPLAFVAASSSVTVQLRGHSNLASGTSYYDNISVRKVTSDSTGTLTHYPLDTSSTLYALPAGETLGSELVTNGGFDSATGWNISTTGTQSIVVSGGTVSFTTNGTSETATVSRGWSGAAGGLYLVTLGVLSGNGGNLKLFPVGTTSTVGEHSFACTPGTKVFALYSDGSGGFGIARVAGSAATAVIDNISVREIPSSAILWTNPLTPKRYRREGRAWVGDNLLANPNFTQWSGDNPVGWAMSGETASSYITQDAAGMRIVTSGTSVYCYQLVLVAGARYESVVSIPAVTGVIKLTTTGGYYLYDGSVWGAVIMNARKTFIAGGTGVYVMSAGACDAVVSSASIRHILEPAS